MSIKLTENAQKKIRSFYEGDPEIVGKPLRVGIESGGCAGFSYVLGVSEQGENDNLYPYMGFDVVVDREQLKLMGGLSLDYVETLTSSGFKFEAANKTGGCGCGSSCSL